MSNRLSMAKINSIETLHQSGHSNREIARLLGIDRGTVNRYVRRLKGQESQKRPNPQTGSDPPEVAVLTARNGPASQCGAHRQRIESKLDQGLSVKRIHQDLVTDHGFAGSYHSVRRFVLRLGRKHPLPFRRMETLPGEEAQIDFGTGAPVIGPDGKQRRPWMFRIVLSCSRKAYSEVVWRQTSDNFIAAIENAFHYFGGVPKRLVIDNLKAAVKRADWYDPEIHPKLQSFAVHYSTAFVPTKPYTPEHKGKVESGVKYVKNNALKGRTFSSLEEQNEFLLNWEATVADTRIHGTTKKQVRQQFEAIERPGVAATSSGPIRNVSRSSPECLSRRTRRSRSGLLLGTAGVCGPPSLGSLGQSVGSRIQ